MKNPTSAEIDKWLVQMRKGAAEFAVLSLLGRGPNFGSRMLDSMTEVGQLNVSEGSIYPLLKRLEADGKILSSWKQDEDAIHPRKYYALTKKGRETVQAMDAEWRVFSKAMNTLRGSGDA